MTNRNIATTWLAIAAAGIVQTAVLGHMIWNRYTLLSTGREIVAEVIPVDPRDLFRGDYVILGYGFGQAQNVSLPAGTRTGHVVYTTLKKADGTKWETAAVTGEYPKSPDAETVVLKGRVTHVYEDPARGLTGGIRYGIESYFVPEGTGRDLEQQVRNHKIDAVLAIGSDGEAAIKGLIIDGQRLPAEPFL
jgi:uncharacterized membrane-anchored protein